MKQTTFTLLAGLLGATPTLAQDCDQNVPHPDSTLANLVHHDITAQRQGKSYNEDLTPVDTSRMTDVQASQLVRMYRALEQPSLQRQAGELLVINDRDSLHGLYGVTITGEKTGFNQHTGRGEIAGHVECETGGFTLYPYQPRYESSDMRHIPSQPMRERDSPFFHLHSDFPGPSGDWNVQGGDIAAAEQHNQVEYVFTKLDIIDETVWFDVTAYTDEFVVDLGTRDSGVTPTSVPRHTMENSVYRRVMLMDMYYDQVTVEDDTMYIYGPDTVQTIPIDSLEKGSPMYE